MNLRHLPRPKHVPGDPPVLLSFLSSLWGVVTLRPVRRLLMSPDPADALPPDW
jgi:hypothetical protein